MIDKDKKEITEQVNIQEICRRHNLGRFDLILVATKVARYEDIRPHDALKKMLEIEDMNVYFKEAKEKQIKAEFSKKF
jgi:hypothetical protein